MIENAGWGTNEKGIIEIICHRNAAQKKLIKEAYEEMYNENLIQRFEKELSGNFEVTKYLPSCLCELDLMILTKVQFQNLEVKIWSLCCDP